MILYVLQGRGVFGSSSDETLPASLRVICAEEVEEVRLDGKAIPVRNDEAILPTTLTDGYHDLKVNGRACERLLVKRGKVRPAGEDFRRLIPAVFRLYELDLRLCALEEKAHEKEIDWLK